MASRSARLVDYLTSLQETQLAPELVQAAMVSLLDSLGCGLYGSRQQWGEIVNAFVLSECSRGTATLYGSSVPVSPARAALANGTSTHGFEIDDILHGHSHPGSVVVSAALAAAEHAGASGARLLLGVVAGYEMMGRLGSALGYDCGNRGFHVTGVAGPIAAAVGAGIVMGLDAPQLLSAIGNACSGSSGIKAFTQGTGGMAKRMHAGRAAESGLVASELAQRGFTGPMEGIDGRFGLLEVIGGAGARAEFLDEALGSALEITKTWVKVYPCCGAIHTTIQGLEALRREHSLVPAQIAEIRVYANRRCVEQNGRRDPADTMAAQYSIPFCAGAAIVVDPADPATYAAANLGNPAVRAVADRTSLVPDAEIERVYPAHLAARVEVVLVDGTKIGRMVLDPHGSHADPCSPADIETKFRRLAGSVKAADTVERIIAAVRALPAAASVTALSGALREENIH